MVCVRGELSVARWFRAAEIIVDINIGKDRFFYFEIWFLPLKKLWSIVPTNLKSILSRHATLIDSVYNQKSLKAYLNGNFTDCFRQHKTEYNLKINLTQKDGCWLQAILMILLNMNIYLDFMFQIVSLITFIHHGKSRVIPIDARQIVHW